MRKALYTDFKGLDGATGHPSAHPVTAHTGKCAFDLNAKKIPKNNRKLNPAAAQSTVLTSPSQFHHLGVIKIFLSWNDKKQIISKLNHKMQNQNQNRTHSFETKNKENTVQQQNMFSYRGPIKNKLPKKNLKKD